MKPIDGHRLIKNLRKYRHENISVDGLELLIEQMPSTQPEILACGEGELIAQPERKTGRWIPVTNGRGGHECDQCHSYAPAWQTGEERLTDFCPSCGARMSEVEHETD